MAQNETVRGNVYTVGAAYHGGERIKDTRIYLGTHNGWVKYCNPGSNLVATMRPRYWDNWVNAAVSSSKAKPSAN